MRNVDCEYLVRESHNCCHKERSSSWRRKIGAYPTCGEFKHEYMNCVYKETLWDMLKRETNNGLSRRDNSLPKPPPRILP